MNTPTPPVSQRSPFDLRIALACNNPDNGHFQGWAEDATIDLPDGESVNLNGPRVSVREEAKRIKIGRVSVFPLRSWEWYGNWCWNAWQLTCHDARSVANYLKLRGWTCDCAPEEIFQRWERKGEITPEEFAMFRGESTRT